MRRIVAASWLAFGFAGVASAGEDDALPLTPPLLKPANQETPADPPPPSSPPSPPPVGPVLAVPGIPLGNRPRLTRAPVSPRAIEPSAPAASEPTDLPALFGPSGMPSYSDSSVSPRLEPEPAGRTLTLESIPANEPKPGRGGDASIPSPTPFSRGDAREPQPQRRSSLFGRFLAPYSGSRLPNTTDDGITVEPRTDPATDAAVKRRLEHQIRAGYGEQLRSLDVRVMGRNVVIRARVARFWQRRGVRRSLESLPTLSGYRTTIEVD